MGESFYFMNFLMASYDHLPVYQDSFEILTILSRLVVSFPKEYKYTFGERLQNYALNVLVEISLASLSTNTKEKSEHLVEAKKNIELIKIIWRACNSVGILSHNQYTEKLILMVSISKQLTAWKSALS